MADGSAKSDLPDLDLASEPIDSQRRHHGGGGFSHHGPVLFRRLGEDQRWSANIAIHELSHYWLHASTPYGLVLDELANRQTRCALRYAIELTQAKERVVVPGHSAARLLESGHVQLSPACVRAVERWVKPWSHAIYLEHLLEGQDNHAVRSTALPDALRWWGGHERQVVADAADDGEVERFEPASEYQLRLIDMWAQGYEELELSARPQFRFGDRAVPIGAHTLFESLATSMENFDVRSSEFLVSDLGRPYMAPFVAVMDKFGMERVDSPETWLCVAATFSILVDLALFVPMGGVYSGLRHDQMTWADLHPGYRFSQLLEALDADDWVDGVDESSPWLQVRLSRRLGWPSPDRFLERGASLSRQGRHGAHSAACERRLGLSDRGIQWADGNLDLVVGEHLKHFGPMQVLEDVRCVVPGDSGAERLDHVLAYALHQFGWMAMASGRIAIEELEPPMLSTSEVFDGVDSPEDFRSLLVGALPFLDEAHYVSVEHLRAAAP